MSKRIDEVEGIGLRNAVLLISEGIETTDKLLAAGRDSKGRKQLSERTSISEKKLLTLVSMCDLFRVSGVSVQFAELLEAAGVHSVKELRMRRAANLALEMAEVNQAKRLSRVSPSILQTGIWIEQANLLEPIVSH